MIFFDLKIHFLEDSQFMPVRVVNFFNAIEVLKGLEIPKEVNKKYPNPHR